MTEQQCPLCGIDIAADTFECPNCHTNILLARHITNLESRLAKIEQHLASPARPESAASPPPPAQKTATASQKRTTTWQPKKSPKPAKIKPKAPSVPNPMLQSDFWLNKIGIGLIFLAMVFLFNYAVTQGWLTPWIRVIIGFVAGAILLGLGGRLAKNHRHFSQVLAGGGIAIEYLSIFAAMRLYHLIPFALALLLMSLVTMLAFVLALRQDEATYAFIGISGGLATPFLLDVSPQFDTAMLIAYTSIILLLAGIIYWRRGWQLLWWTAAVGGWLILIVILFDLAESQRWFVQAGVLITALVAWGIPIGREILQRRPRPHLGFADRFIPSGLQSLLNLDVHLSTFLSPAIALTLSSIIWDVDKSGFGWLSIGFALLLAVAALLLGRSQARPRLSIHHGWMSAIFLFLGLVGTIHNAFMPLAVVLEAVALTLIARRWQFQTPERWGLYAFWAINGLMLFSRLTGHQKGIPIFNSSSLSDLAIILLVALLFMRPGKERIYFWVAAHIFFLIWLARELGAIASGQALVSAAWGLYALVLLGISFVRHERYLRWAGLATLFLLTAKLFLVDLAEVRTFWRILLFAGIGILFLLISFFYQRFIHDDTPEQI